jgi:hypothetical protein
LNRYFFSASADLNFTVASGAVSASHEIMRVPFSTLRSPSFTPIVAPGSKRSVLSPVWLVANIATVGSGNGVASPSSVKSIVAPSCSRVP